MTDAALMQECTKAMQILKSRGLVPNRVTRALGRSTGNLELHGVQIQSVGDGIIKVFVNEDEAPYMKYTNEPWKNRNGKKNPNECWWNAFAFYFINQLSAQINGAANVPEGVDLWLKQIK